MVKMNMCDLCVVITLLAALASCTKEGRAIYEPDPDDPKASALPLVTVIYDPNALGDRSYNDLIYRGVEDAAARYGIRTLQQSPHDYQEGMGYMQTMFNAVIKSQEDTVRRLYIVAASSFDDYLRQNSHVFDDVPSADLLYLETNKPLDSKGSTLYLPYYGAMYEAAAVIPAFNSNITLIGSNPEDLSVAGAIEGFKAGFAADYFDASAQAQDEIPSEKNLQVIYLADKAGQGYSIPDTTALKLLKQTSDITNPCLVPVCGGSGRLLSYLDELFLYADMMGVDVVKESSLCNISVVKHIDRAVDLCISQWLSAEGMPKHQTFGLASGYTGVSVHPFYQNYQNRFQELVPDALRERIHEDAIRKEEAYGK